MKHFSCLTPLLVLLVGFAALAVYVQRHAAQAQIRIPIKIKPAKPKPPPSTRAPDTPKPPVAGKSAPPKIEMVTVPGGSFLMGSSANEADRFNNEEPQHGVTVLSFAIGKFEVTQAQWRAVMGTNPSNFKGDDLPVEQVSWNDAKEFCRRLSQMTGKAYRLPTEAEWEYAARAGATGRGPYGIEFSEMAWCGMYSGGKTHPVGQKKANAFGLHDMHGNVSEWCEDIWHNNYNGAPTDGSAWLSGGNSSDRVLRGGSWLNYGRNCCSAGRGNNAPGNRYITFGFRVVVGARTP